MVVTFATLASLCTLWFLEKDKVTLPSNWNPDKLLLANVTCIFERLHVLIEERVDWKVERNSVCVFDTGFLRHLNRDSSWEDRYATIIWWGLLLTSDCHVAWNRQRREGTLGLVVDQYESERETCWRENTYLAPLLPGTFKLIRFLPKWV